VSKIVSRTIFEVGHRAVSLGTRKTASFLSFFLGFAGFWVVPACLPQSTSQTVFGPCAGSWPTGGFLFSGGFFRGQGIVPASSLFSGDRSDASLFPPPFRTLALVDSKQLVRTIPFFFSLFLPLFLSVDPILQPAASVE